MSKLDRPFFSRTDTESTQRITRIIFKHLVERRAIIHFEGGQSPALTAIQTAVLPTVSMIYAAFNGTCRELRSSAMLDTVLDAHMRVVSAGLSRNPDAEHVQMTSEDFVKAMSKMLAETTVRRVIAATEKGLSTTDATDVLLAQTIVDRLEMMFVDAKVQVTYLAPSAEMRDAYYELDANGRPAKELTREEHDARIRELESQNELRIERASVDSEGGHIFYTRKGVALRRDPEPHSPVIEMEADEVDLDSLSTYTPTREDESDVSEFLLSDILGTRRVPTTKPITIMGTARQLTKDRIVIDDKTILLTSLTPGASLVPVGAQYALLPAVQDIFLELTRELSSEFQSIFTDKGVESEQLRAVITSLEASQKAEEAETRAGVGIAKAAEARSKQSKT